MVNSETNINKTNNHPSPSHWTQNDHDTGNSGSGTEQARKCGGIKPGNGIPNLPSESPTAIHTKTNDKNTYTDSRQPKKDHILSQQMKESVNMNSTIAELIKRW